MNDRSFASRRPLASRLMSRLGLASLTLSLLLLQPLAGCSNDSQPDEPPQGDPLLPYLPKLPDAMGPVVARAGRLTNENFAAERIPGPASQGLVGDYFMANDQIRVVVQQPSRSVGPLPYGGNIIDLDFAKDPVGDQFGELGLFLLTGRTANFTDAEVVRDGSGGGPAVLRFRGADVLDDYIQLEALGPFAALFNDRLYAQNQLGLKLAVTYILNPGASHVEVYYSFYNPTAFTVDSNWGTLTDSGGAVWNYIPGLGFADLGVEELLTRDLPPAEYYSQQGVGVSYATVPEFQDIKSGAIVLPITGIALSFHDLQKKADLFSDSSLTISMPAGSGAQRMMRVAIARGGQDGIERIIRKDIKHQPTRPVAGVISGTIAGESIHIGIGRADKPGTNVPYTTMLITGTDKETAFTTELPPGPYIFQAEGASHRQSAPVSLATPVGGDDTPTKVKLTLPEPAMLSYHVTDVDGHLIPAKLSIVGATPPLLPGVAPISEHSIPGLVAVHHSLTGDSSQNTQWDHPVAVAPGTYRIVISRGPEWTRFEQKLTLTAGAQVMLTPVLERVIDTTGYLACDFHQHSINSPDSMVGLEQRVINNLNEGVEFVSSSDHDFVTDYRPVIARLNARGLMDSIPGEEMTPFGYGHFITWPMNLDANSPSNGAFDWGGGEMPDIAPAGIYAGARKLGAKIVQINHPRLSSPGILDFMQNFDRAALRFDFGARTFYGDKNAQKLTSAQLGLAADAEVFADGFDTLEVANGVSTSGPDRDGERHDPTTERVLRDWMNFLSFGFTPVATGNSDTHNIVESAGSPRTLVRVMDDSPAALMAGAADAVIDTLLGRAGAHRDAVVTNGPFLQLTTGSGTDRVGIGGTAQPAAGKLHIEVEVRSPEWMPVNTVEVFANTTFQSPEPAMAEQMVPALCFSSQPTLSERCRKAAYNGALTVETLTTARGGKYLRARIAVDADVLTLLKGNRAGSKGQDLWLVARTFGDQSMFPVEPHGISDTLDVNQLLDGAVLRDQGAFPLAFTNPLFVDVDGGGWHAPFQP